MRVLAGLFLFLMSCSISGDGFPKASQTNDIYIDYRFSQAELAEAEKAIEDWNRFYGREVFSIKSREFDFWPEIIQGKGVPIFLQPRCYPGQGGWVEAIGGRFVHICPLSSDLIRPVVAHELGHILGMVHSDDPNSIMFPTVSAGSRVASCIGGI